MKGLDSIAARARRGEKLDDVLVIDAHGHIGRWYSYPFPTASAEDMLRVMDRVGVDCACVSHIVAACGSDFVRGNDELIEAVQRHPGRFFGYISVNPNHPQGVLEEIHRCEAQGLRGVKIHSYHGKKYTDAAYQPAYARANEMGYPVLAHTWGGNLDEMRELAQEYPRVNWILGHSGVTEVEQYTKIGAELENVYLEICTSLTAYRLVERLVHAIGAHKVLFGSDCSFLALTQQIGRVAFAQITEEEKRQVLGLNAKKIFRL